MRSIPSTFTCVAALLVTISFFTSCYKESIDSDADIPGAAAGETCPMPCGDAPQCSATQVPTCCACLPVPTEAAQRCSSDICESASGGGDVDLSCFNEDRWRSTVIPGGTVTLMGLVDVLLSGGDTTRGIVVEIYETDDDANLGSFVGGFTTDDLTEPCSNREAVLAPYLVEGEDEVELCSGSCSMRINDAVEGCRKLGFFAIENVPTHIPLVITTSGDDGWSPVYEFNVMLFDEDAVDTTLDERQGPMPTIFRRVRAIESDDYREFSRQAGLDRTVPQGHGSVLGEVRDCGNVRVANVQVGLSIQPELLTYFEDEEPAVPDSIRRHGTNWRGRFAALDIDPEDNPIQVSALGLIDGELLSLGWVTVRVLPGSLSIFTLAGTRPGIDQLSEPSEVQ